MGCLWQLVSFVNINDSFMCLRSVLYDGGWNLKGLTTVTPYDIVDYIHQLPTPNNLDLQLKYACTWKHAMTCAFIKWVLLASSTK